MTIREFVRARLAAGDTPEQAWRAAQKHFTGGWQVVGWNYVCRIARQRRLEQEAAARQERMARAYALADAKARERASH